MKIKILFLAITLLAASSAAAADRALPSVIAYQSQLFDDGGNPVADGEARVAFRITDANGALLYEEYQTLDVVRGSVSALVGNGLTGGGAPTGGIPAAALDPTGAKYLEVQAGDFPPTSAMEIASVPYATYADIALGAIEGAIDSLSIADGSIAYEDLSDDLKSRLADDITAGHGADQIIYRDELDSLYRAPQSAAKIGLSPGLNYSGANDLQGAIQDIDRAVKRRDERIDAEAEARSDADAAEITARSDADSAEALARAATDSTLLTNIINEATARGNADTTLQTNIENEASARGNADTSLQTNIENEATARVNADATKVSKTGDTMSGELEVLLHGVPPSNAAPEIVQIGEINKIRVGAALSDLYTLTASNARAGESVLNNIHIASGEIAGDGTVTVPEPFAVSECEIIASFFSGPSIEGIDAFCVRACPNDANRTYRVRCWMDGNHEGGTGCEENLANCELSPQAYDNYGTVDDDHIPDQGFACLSHYLMICVKATL